MRSKIRFLIRFFSVIAAILAFTHLSPTMIAFAANLTAHLPISPGPFDLVPSPPADKTGQEIAIDLVFSGLRYVKIIVVVVGILFISLMGYTLIAKGDNEEEVSKAKMGLVYAIVAFMMISMAEEFGKMFDMRTATIIGTPQEILGRVRLFDRQVELFTLFVKYVIGAFATLMVIISATKLITSGDSEEETTKHKKSILFSGAGLILIYVGDIFINRVFYRVDRSTYAGITGVHPQIDAKEGIEQIIGVTNFIVSFVGPVAVLMLLAGAIMYIVSRGEEEQMNKAKRLIFASVVGIVLIFGAFAIVNVVVSGRLEEIGALM